MIKQVLKSRNPEEIAAYMRENGLVLRDGKIQPKDDSIKEQFKQLASFWDSRQLARKILLNSLNR